MLRVLQSPSAILFKLGQILSTFRNVPALPYHWLLPAIFFCVGLLYIYASPNFEASDTERHAALIDWIADNGELPVQSPSKDTLYRQEASQPPLYYLAMAAVWRAFDTADFDAYFAPNPLVIAGVPGRLGNRNMVFYRQPYPPDLQGSSLALYAIRILTLGMGAATVAAVYQSARAVMPNRIDFAVLAASLAAFNPMFIFISASVSNDPLVSMLTALICWQMLLMLRDGFQTGRSIILALLVALAALAKLNGLVVGAVAALAGCYVFMRGRDWRGFITLGALMLVLWLVISGWWLARNLMLYGELFGTGAMLDNFGRRSASLLSLVAEEFEGLRISYWALFGAFSILVHKLFYLAMDGLSLLGVIGLLIHIARRRRKLVSLAPFIFLGIALALGGAMLLWWSMQTSASTGRLLFPYITSISVLLALGIYTLRIPALLVAIPMFVFAMIAPFVYIIPQYDHPPKVQAVPDSATRTFIRWDDIALVGYEIPEPGRWSAGDEIPLTLYWQPRAQSDELQALFITLIDADGEAIATIDSFPGWGALPTMWWEPGVIYRDDYILQIPPDAKAFTTVQLHLGWYNWADRIDKTPMSETGEEITVSTLPIGALVAGDKEQKLGAESISDGTVFGDALKLNAYQFSAGHILELEWQVLNELRGDWRVFAFALSAPFQEGNDVDVLLQKDSVPSVSLDFLKTGESFITRHEFQLPSGYQSRHGIYVGWYNQELAMRLEAPYPENMLLLEDLAFYG